jgi:hypothetical protein
MDGTVRSVNWESLRRMNGVWNGIIGLLPLIDIGGIRVDSALQDILPLDSNRGLRYDMAIMAAEGIDHTFMARVDSCPP